MAREHSFEPVAVLVRAHADKGFLERDCALDVVACLAHVLDAVLVGFEFGLATVSLHQELGAEPRAGHVEVAVVAVAARDLRGEQPALQQHALAHLLRRMTGRRMHDFMPEHCREFRFRFQLHEEPAIDRDFSAGQCPGIRNRVVQHDELIRQLAVAHGRQAIADALHVVRQGRVERVVAALGLAHRRVVLLADRELRAFADEHQLVLAR